MDRPALQLLDNPVFYNSLRIFKKNPAVIFPCKITDQIPAGRAHACRAPVRPVAVRADQVYKPFLRQHGQFLPFRMLQEAVRIDLDIDPLLLQGFHPPQTF